MSGAFGPQGQSPRHPGRPGVAFCFSGDSGAGHSLMPWRAAEGGVV